MLFHVTMTHTEENCPAYDRDNTARFIAEMETLETRAGELGVQVHSILWGAPEHVAYALVEADNLGAIALRLHVSVSPGFQSHTRATSASCRSDGPGHCGTSGLIAARRCGRGHQAEAKHPAPGAFAPSSPRVN
ncbi:MAG: hypothetical protein HZY76_13145 [Anaerolineae bacterium]|nr:MAG: hypothetical protein HZY76_13145 [Anaerolineae bacterium]